jgi:hypothetical protein
MVNIVYYVNRSGLNSKETVRKPMSLYKYFARKLMFEILFTLTKLQTLQNV